MRVIHRTTIMLAALTLLVVSLASGYGKSEAASNAPALKIKVLTGDGAITSARAMAETLSSLGYVIQSVDYAPKSDFIGTVVFYKEPVREVAEDMAGRLGVQALARPMTWTSEFDIIVVTGSEESRGRSSSEVAVPKGPAGPSSPGAGDDVKADSSGTRAAAAGAELPDVFRSIGLGSDEDYVIGPEDVLMVRVWDNEDLSGKFPVSMEGYISYQLLGKVKAAGHTPGQLSAAITKLLSDGYIVNPQVSVQVDEYKSQKVVINGSVSKEGIYYLKKRINLVEAVAMAGGVTDKAGWEVVILRAGVGMTVDFQKAIEGDPKHNLVIISGDLISIPEAKSFLIDGEVEKPGEYKIKSRNTTVRMAISLAGGATSTAAIKRSKIVRIVDGVKQEIRVDLDDLVLPEDNIIVPESYF